ncbi:MAG: DUF2796 domain-containing protein [Gammaproteobacteria bacterium]
MKTTSLITCGAITLLASTTALLNPALASEKRQLDSHEHGVTLLNIALENSELFLEVEAPAMNIVGFEYAPSTTEQQQSVADALKLLEAGDRMFQPNGSAKCSLVSADAQHIVDDEHEGHDENHDDAHDEHHDEHHEEDGLHDDHKEHGSEAAHAEFRAQYRFQCSEPDKLTEVTVGLLDNFKLTEEVEASFIGPQNQTFKKLTPDQTTLKL